MKPMLYVGGLTGRVYVATRYKVDQDLGNGEARFYVVGDHKYDVSDNFERVALELGWKPPGTKKRPRLKESA